MPHHQELLAFTPSGPGLHEITPAVRRVVERSGVACGLCTLFVQHTSASLLLQENADPSARHDLERFYARLAPEGDPRYTHVAEGPDDMPAHLRSALSRTSETVPIRDGRLALGTWQGIYLFEHRRRPGTRRLIVHVWGE
ncbi:MAG: YjbQ family protein [Planctomycetota bacterium]|nr:MAG: YjbQ family protein [Planctomycetota bacterium]